MAAVRDGHAQAAAAGGRDEGRVFGPTPHRTRSGGERGGQRRTQPHTGFEWKNPVCCALSITGTTS